MAPIPLFNAYISLPRFPNILGLIYPVEQSTSLLSYLKVRSVSVYVLFIDWSVNVAAENVAPSPALPNLFKERQQFNTKFSQSPPLYLGALFAEYQNIDAQKIVWSRPPTADATIPIVLLHQIMRDFTDGCNKHEPIGEDNMLVLNLTHAMSRFFPNANARAAELRDILQDSAIPVTTVTLSFKDRFFQHQ
jgi:hypothetical protein